jgi:phosphoglycerol transferase MdoB-like AlkP superfamily enzyme
MKENYFKNLNFKTNSYSALLKQFLLMMALFSVCRIGFYLFNTDFFPDVTMGRFARIMWGGLRFDLAGLLYINSLFILLSILPFEFRFNSVYQKVLKYIFFITNGLALAANVADFVYYRFTLRRTTMTVFSQFKNETNGFTLFFQFLIDYWYAVLFWAALMFIVVKVFNRIKSEGPQLKNAYLFYGSGILLMPLIIYLFIGGARGGFAHSTRPITISNAAEYAATPKDINLVLNTPFAFMRTARANVIEKVNYFASEEELEKEFSPVHLPTDSLAFDAQNVVVIILESFSKEFIGFYNKDLDSGKYSGYSPFLDSLLGVSRAYQYSMANGRKSIDAMPSVICSIPSIEVPYVLSHYSGNKVNSMATLLKRKGYYTSFFHGAPNGSMGFQAFANLCGFEDYYGKDEYNNNDDYDGIWGIWDEPFLQFFASKLNTFKEPFYSTLFTVSSHHPYNLPGGYEKRFKGGSMEVYRTIQYTDFALKRFFESASKMPWYKNTLFVFTADHASAAIKYPEYNTAWGYFSIPVFFYKPGSDWKTNSQEIIQQIDIMPTVLGYLKYDEPYVAYGRDLFNSPKESFAFNYLDNTYQIFKDDYLLQFDGTKTIGLYHFKQDKFLRNNLVNTRTELIPPLEIKLKAFIQQYNNRMVDDHLTVESPASPTASRF